jgi:hypothetical protein
MCQTRVYPTPKVKFPPSMILLGLNAPPPRWCTLQQDVSPMLPLPWWLLSKCPHARCTPPLTMCHMSSHVPNATLMCANVVTKLQCSSSTYVSWVHQPTSMKYAPQPKCPQVKCPTSKVYITWSQAPRAKCPPPSA